MSNSFLLLKLKCFLPADFFRGVLKIVICLLLFSQTGLTQYHFNAFTTDNGLPQNGVRGIAQTPDGYLWFTTFDGLVRFDGLKFTVFDKNNSPGISSNRFFLLHVEPDGTLFAGTEDGGLTVYANGKFRTLTVADGLPSNSIEQFKTDVNGEFIIKTAAGNCYFRKDKFVPVPKADAPDNNLFYKAPSGSLWVYDRNSIRQTTPDKRQFTYPIKIDYYNEGLSGVIFFEDSESGVWFGDLAAVYRLKDGNITKFTEQDGVPTHTILRPYVEDADGGIWFASGWFSDARRVGLVRFYDGRFTIWGKEAGLSNLFVSQIFKDRDNMIWASSNGGLSYLQKQFIKSYSVADGLIYPEVYPILQTKNGDIFVGTIRGLSRYREGKFSDVLTKNDNGSYLSVSALFEDERGRLWVGSSGENVFQIVGDNVRTIKIGGNSTVSAIESDRAGNIWLGTNKGLIKFKGDRLIARYTTAEGLSSDDVKTIHADKNGGLWFGTYGGLSKFENERFVSLTTADGLASDRVRSIYEDADGVLWIGTYDGGLSRFKDGRFFNFTVNDGLFSNGVFQILEDGEKNFWISSNRGIFRVKRQELEDFANGKIKQINSVAFGKQDGMLNTECNGGQQPAGIKTTEGKFWFPTQDGVVVINPEDVSLNPNPPSVQIESVLIERSTTDFQKGISLKAKKDNLEIRFTGISFIKPEQVKFRYRIEGLDEAWTDVGTIREVYFPSLPSGEYTFHVIAANSDGVWNEEGARLRIRVVAPFWQTTWFILLCALFATAIVFSIFRLRERELNRRQIVQQEFSRRLLESQEQERKRIASEMHDSLGQYLLAIKNWALFGLNSLPEENAAREYLGEVSETSSLALEEVREIAHNLRPYQLERLGLTNTLEYMLKNLKTPIQISSEIENIDGALSKDAEIIFYRIAQESVNNVLKHSGAENLWITVRKNIGNLEFVCRDDGCGFDFAAAQNSPKSGLGLNGIAERVKILNGNYEINSETGKGTTVTVNVPL